MRVVVFLKTEIKSMPYFKSQDLVKLSRVSIQPTMLQHLNGVVVHWAKQVRDELLSQLSPFILHTAY